MISEFDLIAKYFAPLTGEGGLGLLDDAAIMTPSMGKDLVLSKDMLVAGVHFFEKNSPDKIAIKALGVNLSDIAAKGAAPIGYMLGLALPDSINEKWIAEFSKGLKETQENYGFSLLGGDTVRTSGPLTISISIFGEVAGGQTVLRSGAKVGDVVYVTGTIGDSALGLLDIKAGVESSALITRYLEPQPRVVLGKSLAGIVSAGMDISDGLLADACHLLKASHCGMIINRDKVPLSDAAQAKIAHDNSLWSTILSGGDDYELLLACRPDKQHVLQALAMQSETIITEIGNIIDSETLDVRDENGVSLEYKELGFRHF